MTHLIFNHHTQLDQIDHLQSLVVPENRIPKNSRQCHTL